MRGRVVMKFGGREELRPCGRVIGIEDAEISFEFLIGSFHLTISLGVVGHGESYIVFEEAGEFSGKC